MIVPQLMAVWFGVSANRAGRSGLLSALGGAAQAFAVGTIVVNLAAYAVDTIAIDGYLTFRFVTFLLSLVITVLLGAIFTRNRDSKSSEGMDSGAQMRKRLRQKAQANGGIK